VLRRTLAAHSNPALDDRSPYEFLHGETPDISEFIEFDFYQQVWYVNLSDFPTERIRLGRWLGVAHRVGQPLCYWILTQKGKVVARSLVQTVPDLDAKTDKFLKSATTFDADIERRIGNNLTKADLTQQFLPNESAFDPDIGDIIDEYDPYEPDSAQREADDYTPEEMDKLIGVEVLLGKGDSMTQAKVIGRKRDSDGNPIGT